MVDNEDIKEFAKQTEVWSKSLTNNLLPGIKKALEQQSKNNPEFAEEIKKMDIQKVAKDLGVASKDLGSFMKNLDNIFGK